MFVDRTMRHSADRRTEYDTDSLWSKEGSVSEEIVHTYVKNHRFFTYPLPKTTRREHFGGDKAIELIKISHRSWPVS